jgi:hypothetical protein
VRLWHIRGAGVSQVHHDEHTYAQSLAGRVLGRILTKTQAHRLQQGLILEPTWWQHERTLGRTLT